MTTGVQIKFEFPDWAGALKSREAELNLFQAAIIQTNRGLLFDSEGAHNGHQKWAPLKFRNGQILSNRGKLRKSIAPSNAAGVAGPDGVVRFAGDMITIGTKLLYASMMNDGTTKMPGGVLRPRRAKALKIPLPSGVNATDTTKDLRSAKIDKAIAKAVDAHDRTKTRAAKARQRFSRTGSDSALRATIGAERSRARQAGKLAAMYERRGKIHATGKGGEGFIFVKSVKIPARNFDEWNEQDQAEMDASLLAKIAKIMNGAKR